MKKSNNLLTLLTLLVSIIAMAGMLYLVLGTDTNQATGTDKNLEKKLTASEDKVKDLEKVIAEDKELVSELEEKITKVEDENTNLNNVVKEYEERIGKLENFSKGSNQ